MFLRVLIIQVKSYQIKVGWLHKYKNQATIVPVDLRLYALVVMVASNRHKIRS